MPASAKNSKSPENLDREIQQAEMMFESARSQLEYLEENARMVDSSISEHLRTRETIEHYGEAKEMLMPVGAGVFIMAKPAKKDKAVVAIGAGASIEMPAKDALVHIDKNLEKLNNSRAKVTERISQIKQKVEELAAKMESLYGSPEGKNE
ncbi:MAG: prefoldin subunit alpha [Candidatus Thermoplasmatota archaeon]|nr:prefoldin subunit alpha [Candidatus Thermoplasmatota archaeon]